MVLSRLRTFFDFDAFHSEGTVYRIERQAGEGLTANVFKATRIDSRGHIQQTVALKILKSRTAIPWLRREFETLARVDSPHCVRVLAWENTLRRCALVLEWIDGVTLYDLTRHQSLSLDLLQEVAAQVAKGLAALEQQGLHHGDLSPKNILVDQVGQVKIVDFATGSAKDSKTIGTFAYLAPEIWLGEETSLDADLFALSWIIDDAQDGFRNVPLTARAARERAFRAPPSVRDRPLTNSCEKRRNELAKRVRDCMNDKEEPSLQTVFLANKADFGARNFSLRVASVGLGVFLGIVTPVRAEAPLLPIDQSGLVTVTSYRWLSVAVDDQALGYAPARKRLAPGRHILQWRSSTSGGAIEFDVRPGQKLHLANPQDQR